MSAPLVDLGDWEKEGQPLGSGGQAIVYRAYKKGDAARTPYVVKVLKEWRADSKAASEHDQRGRFKREVSALEGLASTGCPNIVPVIASQLEPKAGTQPWYIMPFYAAGPMARTDGDKRVYAENYLGNVDRVLEIAESVAKTLAWMHDHEPQHVHRDVHTGNIFFEGVGGVPILGDFGLVHKYGEPTATTGPREPLGPWQWRPPELQGGSNDKTNPKCDVYLLGGVIYEALSGGQVIDETQQVGGAFTHEQPAYSLSQFSEDPRIPLITSLLKHMLARDPDTRLHARDVAEAARKIRSWKAGDAQPILRSSFEQLEEAAARYRESARSYRDDVVAKELRTRCDAICARLDLPPQPAGHFQARIAIESNQGDGVPTQAIQVRFPGAVWAAARVRAQFEPTPPITLFSYVLLIRTDKGREIVAILNEHLKWTMLANSFPDDPDHDNLVAAKANEEAHRLALALAAQLEEAREQDRATAGRDKQLIPGLQSTPETARLIRHLMSVSMDQVSPWVEADQAMEALQMTADVFRAGVKEGKVLGLIDAQVAARPGGFARARVLAIAFVGLAPKVLPDLDLESEGMKLLRIVGKKGTDSRVSSEEIEREAGVPLALANTLFEFLESHQFVRTGGSRVRPDSLYFGWAGLEPAGERVLRGFEKLIY